MLFWLAFISLELQTFACSKYSAEYRIMSKIDVNGSTTSPIYAFLKKITSSGDIGWNFKTYFLVDKDGQVARFDGKGPKALVPEIEKRLNA